MLRAALSRILATFRRQRLDEELSEEVRHAHRDAGGTVHPAGEWPPAEAYYAARRQFGGVTQMKEDLRERRALPPCRRDGAGRAARLPPASKSQRFHGVGRIDAGAGDRRKYCGVCGARCGGAAAAPLCPTGPADGLPPDRPAGDAASDVALLSQLLRFPRAESRVRTPGVVPRFALHPHRHTAGHPGGRRDRVVGPVSAARGAARTGARVPPGGGKSRERT